MQRKQHASDRKSWWNKGGHGVNGVFLQAFAVEEFQELDNFYDRSTN